MYKNIKDIKLNDLKEKCKMIHYFGLGFIQIKIDDTYRLHFYTNKLPKILHEEEVHNHRYNFTSYILKGEFVSKIYKLIPGNKYLLEDESCKKGIKNNKKGGINTAKPRDVVLIEENHYKTGDKYWIEKDVFHRVSGKECITLVEREKPEKEFAQVLQPINKEKICPFSKEVEEKVLWEIVEEMLN